MPQNFIKCDREQVLLMPPSLRDWLPENHLAWTILASVQEMDLSAFYGAYHADGHGRRAYEPAMMVGLLLYAYARGNRSSRTIERACVEDVAYRVIAANRAPDHSTIADFRVRHEAALADLFGEVLGLCKRAGLVKVGVVAIDGTKVSANASMDANRSYQQIVKPILEEARRVDEAEDELYGDGRGDELPEQLRTAEGRRAALRKAKEELERELGALQEATAPDEDAGAPLELDPEQFVTRPAGRRAWLREARRALDERRAKEARPIARSRKSRLKEAARRLEEEHAAHLQANDAYEAWRGRGIAADGSRRMASGAVKPYHAPEEPEGEMNTTDHDSRIVRTAGQPAKQGYNAQAAVNENDIVIAAELTVESPDFGHLEPMVKATTKELKDIGVTKSPQVVVADARLLAQKADGEHRRRRHPGADSARLGVAQGHAAGVRQGSLCVYAARPANRARAGDLLKTTGYGRAGVRPDEVQSTARSLLTPRPRAVSLGMAPDDGDTQPPTPPQPPDSRRGGLTGPPRQAIRSLHRRPDLAEALSDSHLSEQDR